MDERLWETCPELYAERQARFLTNTWDAVKIEELALACQRLNHTIDKIKMRLKSHGEDVDDQTYMLNLG